MTDAANKVLTGDARSSTNFFESDRILRYYLQKHLDDTALNYMRDKLNLLGQQSAIEMDDLSLKADRHTPHMKKRTKYGEKLDEIEFHPAYWKLMGGNGYIEDFVMPKLLRDVNVLPIWEGSGNIIALDILRAAKKSKGLREIIRQIEHAAEESPEHAPMLQNRLEAFQSVWASLQSVEDRDVVESTVKPLFSELIDLYQTALMIEELDDQSAEWLQPALEWKASAYDREVRIEHPSGTGAVHNLIAWDY